MLVSGNRFNLSSFQVGLWFQILDGKELEGGGWTLGHIVCMSPLAPALYAASQPHFKAWSHTPASTVLGIQARWIWVLMSICCFQFLWGFQFLSFFFFPVRDRPSLGRKNTPWVWHVLQSTCDALWLTWDESGPVLELSPIQHPAS